MRPETMAEKLLGHRVLVDVSEIRPRIAVEQHERLGLEVGARQHPHVEALALVEPIAPEGALICMTNHRAPIEAVERFIKVTES